MFPNLGRLSYSLGLKVFLARVCFKSEAARASPTSMPNSYSDTDLHSIGYSEPCSINRPSIATPETISGGILALNSVQLRRQTASESVYFIPQLIIHFHK